MPKKITKEDAELWLKEKAPHIKLLKWGGKASRVNSTFIDLNRHILFDKVFNSLKKEIKRNPECIFNRDSKERTLTISIKEEDVNKWLKDNGNRYKLLKWGGSAVNKNSIFIDVNRDIEFIMSFSELKYILKKNPNRLLGCTKKEHLERRKESLIKKYGVDHPLKIKEIKEKIKETCIKRYGVDNCAKNDKVKAKIENTCIKKYGVKSTALVPKFRKKQVQTMIKKGLANSINGKTSSQIAKDKNCSVTTIVKLFRKFDDKQLVLDYDKTKTSIELILEKWLESKAINFEALKYIKPHYVDFIIENNLIIECDGVYWHSDQFKDRKYHKIKKDFYKEKGFNSLFFRSNEIENDFEIIKSIILNKLNKSKKFYARQCSIIENCDPSFFKENHLMKEGSGKTYGLIHNDKLVSAMQIKWKNKKTKQLEVSRFCHLLNHNVVGGFSKLIKYVVSKNKPNSVVTFIDKRYGNGEYLKGLGWKKVNEDLSFKWTKGSKVVNRMNFPGNSGYDYGYFKLWDCGQAKWEFLNDSEREI